MEPTSPEPIRLSRTVLAIIALIASLIGGAGGIAVRDLVPSAETEAVEGLRVGMWVMVATSDGVRRRQIHEIAGTWIRISATREEWVRSSLVLDIVSEPSNQSVVPGRPTPDAGSAEPTGATDR